MTVKILNVSRGQSNSPIKPQNFLAPDSADGFFFSLFLARNWSFDVVFGSFIFQILLWRIFWARLLPWSTVPSGISSHHERYQMLLLFKAPFLKGTVIYFLNCSRRDLYTTVLRANMKVLWIRKRIRARGALKLDRFHSQSFENPSKKQQSVSDPFPLQGFECLSFWENKTLSTVVFHPKYTSKHSFGP